MTSDIEERRKEYEKAIQALESAGFEISRGVFKADDEYADFRVEFDIEYKGGAQE